MGMCKSCSTVVSAIYMVDGLCEKCQAPNLRAEIQEKKERQEEFEKNKFAIFNSITITTETALNEEIEKRIEVVSSQRIYGINILKDFFSAIRDIVGGRVNSLESAVEDATKEILEDLKAKAYFAGGNAVIGLRIEHTYNNANGGSILSIFATGTVVTLKE